MTERKRDRGFALITAMAVLMLLSMLGAAYLQYMTIEAEEAKLDLRALRARTAAEAGVYAAMGQLQAEFGGPGGLLEGSRTMTFPCPVYRWDQASDLVADERYSSVVTVTVSDESARVNLNHAPVRLLSALLGVDGATARAIRASLPHEGEMAVDPGTRLWMTSPSELLDRRLIKEDQFNALDPTLITFDSVVDPAHPGGHLNLNGASPRVMAALLDVPIEAAEEIIQARPFASLADVSIAAGKDPLTFNWPPDVAMPETLPAELTFETSSFRMTSTAEVQRAGRTSRSTVEAVVAFDGEGRLVVTRWSVGEMQDVTSETETTGEDA